MHLFSCRSSVQLTWNKLLSLRPKEHTHVQMKMCSIQIITGPWSGLATSREVLWALIVQKNLFFSSSRAWAKLSTSRSCISMSPSSSFMSKKRKRRLLHQKWLSPRSVYNPSVSASAASKIDTSPPLPNGLMLSSIHSCKGTLRTLHYESHFPVTFLASFVLRKNGTRGIVQTWLPQVPCSSADVVELHFWLVGWPRERNSEPQGGDISQ